jgi:hypothetical protein
MIAGKFSGIEVAGVDDVPAAREGVLHRGVDRCVEAGLDRMSVNDHDSHGVAIGSSRRPPFKVRVTMRQSNSRVSAAPAPVRD